MKKQRDIGAVFFYPSGMNPYVAAKERDTHEHARGADPAAEVQR